MVEREQDALSPVFRALGDPTRRSMLRRLAAGEQTVTELAEPFRMSLAGASKHIQVLERAGLVRREVRGRTHVCSLAPDRLAEADAWLSNYRRFWSDSLDALERALREPETPTPGESADASDHEG